MPSSDNSTSLDCSVLLVEDHEDTRSVMTRLLRTFGCAVTAVGSVREAIEAIDRQPFQLLVSDIGLPDGSGVEVMCHLRARHGDAARGVAISGYGLDVDRDRTRQVGFCIHLTKPVSVQALRDAMFKAMSGA